MKAKKGVLAYRVSAFRFRTKRPAFLREHHGGNPLRDHDFKRLLDAIRDSNPAQIEHAQMMVTTFTIIGAGRGIR